MYRHSRSALTCAQVVTHCVLTCVNVPGTVRVQIQTKGPRWTNLWWTNNVAPRANVSRVSGGELRPTAPRYAVSRTRAHLHNHIQLVTHAARWLHNPLSLVHRTLHTLHTRHSTLLSLSRNMCSVVPQNYSKRVRRITSQPKKRGFAQSSYAAHIVTNSITVITNHTDPKVSQVI